MKDFQESSVEFTIGQDVRLEGRLGLGRFDVVFDVLSRQDVLRTSEVLPKPMVVNSGPVFYDAQAVFNQPSRPTIHREEMVKKANEFTPQITAQGRGQGNSSFWTERTGRIDG